MSILLPIQKCSSVPKNGRFYQLIWNCRVWLLFVDGRRVFCFCECPNWAWATLTLKQYSACTSKIVPKEVTKSGIPAECKEGVKNNSMSLICHERQVNKAEGEKLQLILCWRAKENIIIEELAETRDQICSVQKSSYVPWIIEMVCS